MKAVVGAATERSNPNYGQTLTTAYRYPNGGVDPSDDRRKDAIGPDLCPVGGDEVAANLRDGSPANDPELATRTLLQGQTAMLQDSATRSPARWCSGSAVRRASSPRSRPPA